MQPQKYLAFYSSSSGCFQPPTSRVVSVTVLPGLFGSFLKRTRAGNQGGESRALVPAHHTQSEGANTLAQMDPCLQRNTYKQF